MRKGHRLCGAIFFIFLINRTSHVFQTLYILKGGSGMSIDLEEQYDKLYRYCYFKVHQRELAEDITQETFLRFFEHHECANNGHALRYLYTIAHNLCIDEYRRRSTELLSDETSAIPFEDRLLTQVSLNTALSELEESDRELLLLRYVNEVPVSVISNLLGISRFAVYRKARSAVKILKSKLREEDFS